VQSIRTVVVLPAAVRAEEAEDLALRDREVDIAHRLDVALEVAAQRARLDRRGIGHLRHRPLHCPELIGGTLVRRCGTPACRPLTCLAARGDEVLGG
jgi:hypothetical protein